MEKTRLKKVDRLIQKELSIIFQQNPLPEYNNILISVTVVRISPDLSVARVYLSIFPSDDSEEIVEKITERTGKIKYELGKKVRNQLRKLPDLKFFVDDSLEYAGKIDNLLK
ncbi:MAG: 30S ribosome-binding factor RbfA [Bacteroidetes bacterium]|nr:MAG: 30S ribosome-binding factor RbfA [Bacteroidota bacterium]RLD85955.1 MAG: 30S ribosome-binding factor RbfA [Bacteroidota bacterium]